MQWTGRVCTNAGLVSAEITAQTITPDEPPHIQQHISDLPQETTNATNHISTQPAIQEGAPFCPPPPLTQSIQGQAHYPIINRPPQSPITPLVS